MTNSRKIAIDILKLADSGENINGHLASAVERLTDSRDRALLINIVEGTLRNRNYLENVLNNYLTMPLKKMSKTVQYILLSASYQFIYLDKIPSHAVVNEAVKLTPQGLKKIVNAVLRNISDHADELRVNEAKSNGTRDLADFYSHPEWLIERWINHYGLEETIKLLKANNVPPKTTIRINKRWVTRDALLTFLKNRDLEVKPTEYSRYGITISSGSGNLTELPEYSEGLFSVKGEASMLAVELLRAGRGKRGWDMAAGVGGKTTHLGEWTDDTGYILATDTSKARLRILEEEALRLGLTEGIEIKEHDARTVDITETFDYILLDAPCSGTGTLSKQADARHKKSLENILENALLQAELLDKAAASLKIDGILLYVTCSLEPEENEEQIDKFLINHPNFTLCDLSEEKYIPECCLSENKKYLKMFPHVHGTDGFFAAKLIKNQ